MRESNGRGAGGGPLSSLTGATGGRGGTTSGRGVADGGGSLAAGFLSLRMANATLSSMSET